MFGIFCEFYGSLLSHILIVRYNFGVMLMRRSLDVNVTEVMLANWSVVWLFVIDYGVAQ